MAWYGHLDVLILGLMLTYVAVTVILVLKQTGAGRQQKIDEVERRQLLAELKRKTGTLRFIAIAAPYLGLGGTCIGILNMYGGGAMEKGTFLRMLVERVAAALVTTAAGLLVAIPATLSHHFVHSRLHLLEGFARVSKFPLRARFSGLPTFGLLGAPCLALCVTAFMTFATFHVPKGLAVEIAPTQCGLGESDRFIALRVSNSGKVFLNFEEEPWDTLAHRLSEAYKYREYRTLYVLADDEVRYQTVADLINLVQNAPASTESAPIRVRLITPVAKNVPCFSAIPLCPAPNASKRLVPCRGASLRGKPNN
jgi:biopolymer transport protein ExbD